MYVRPRWTWRFVARRRGGRAYKALSAKELRRAESRLRSTFTVAATVEAMTPIDAPMSVKGLFKKFLWRSVGVAVDMSSHESIPNFPYLVRRRASNDVAKKLVDGFSHPVGPGLAQAGGHDHTFTGPAQAHDVTVPGEVPGSSRAHLGSRRDESRPSPVAVGLQLKCPFGLALAAGPGRTGTGHWGGQALTRRQSSAACAGFGTRRRAGRSF